MNIPHDPFLRNPIDAGPVLPTVIKPSAQVSIIRLALGAVATLVALLLGLLVLLVIGTETGPIALFIGFVAATLPVPLYIGLVLWIDRYESEPLWMLATAFFWGALIAVFFAFLFNTASGLIVAAMTRSLTAGEMFAAVISAPFVEETAKALILFIFFFWKAEAALAGGGGGLTLIFIVRGAFAPFSHPLFTSMTGIGLGLARQTGNTALKILAPILGLAMAICMHSIWNGSAAIFGGGVFLLTYVIVMVPAFLIMLVVIALALRREGQLVRQFLLTDCERGLLTRQEYDQLCTIRGRMGSSFNAFTGGGIGRWRARMRFNQLASELAFHRSRVSRGVFPANQDPRQREMSYLQALQDLQREIRTL